MGKIDSIVNGKPPYNTISKPLLIPGFLLLDLFQKLFCHFNAFLIHFLIKVYSKFI